MATSDNPAKRQLEDESDCLQVKRQCLHAENTSKNDVLDSVQVENGNVTHNRKEKLPHEADVGITEYISKLPGFSCVIKERYSDFLVNEIDLEGNIIRFTNTDEPQGLPDFDSDVLSKEEIVKLDELDKSDSKEPAPISIDVTEMSKEARTKVHMFIKKRFPNLSSKTESSEPKKHIVIRKELDTKRFFNSGGRGNYTHFVLYKENMDTMAAISAIASILRVPIKKISYAGTKDKRGKTVQAVSAARLEPKKLLALNDKQRMLKVGNVSFKEKELKLGDLFGNRFVIVLRQLNGEMELVKSAMQTLSTQGFINYYGMQRFGTTSVSTHHVGRALLLGNWSEAIDLILQPRAEGQDKHFSMARKIWAEKRDAKQALKHIHRKGSIEGQLLQGLSRYNQNDFINALNCIPRNTRLMYIHSYQSYIWNKVVSRRFQKYGLQVLPGDLIMDTANDAETDSDDVIESPKSGPTYVSEDDVSKDGLIHSVVLPLAGHTILYPNNEIKSWYTEFLNEDGMSMECFKSNVRTYSLRGSYRKIIVKPKDVSWEIMCYDDNELPLALSDWDILQQKTLSSALQAGKHKALKLEITLPASSYATMAIREVSKVDTSIAAQKALCCS